MAHCHVCGVEIVWVPNPDAPPRVFPVDAIPRLGGEHRWLLPLAEGDPPIRVSDDADVQAYTDHRYACPGIRW